MVVFSSLTLLFLLLIIGANKSELKRQRQEIERLKSRFEEMSKIVKEKEEDIYNFDINELVIDKKSNKKLKIIKKENDGRFKLEGSKSIVYFKNKSELEKIDDN